MTQINRNAVAIHAPIISNKRVGQYNQLIIDIGDLSRLCKPGNFVAIKLGGQSSNMILRRAFAISRTSSSATFGGTMELIVAPYGQGSTWLCAQSEGVVLDLILPLGTAFGIPTEPVKVLLVGGGYGSAPLFGLAEVLYARGCRVDMLLGASTGAKIYAPMEGKRSVNSLRIHTEDGSMGQMGRVTDPIGALINDLDIGVIYSCGPMAMLAAIDAITKDSNVLHQCAVEEAMACGVGICMTCVVPVTDGTGAVSMLRSCIDGPVMDGARVAWDKVGKTL
ncbi:MAG: dihydroorotate dehydrogenase electron transfer subunit [Actinomycetota bacterium]|nr:dihydroorotate dehydrogenase electron transfer subunit [Actinomycetota bacterium]